MADPTRLDNRLGNAKYPEPATNAGSPVSTDSNATPAGLRGSRKSPAAPQLPENVRSRPIGEWPTETSRHNPDLERAAIAVGEALGRAVATARRLPGMIQDSVQELKSRLSDIHTRAEVQEKAEAVKDEASHQVRVARVRAEHMARENPAGFIAGVAGTAFAIGMVLGIWRENSRV